MRRKVIAMRGAGSCCECVRFAPLQNTQLTEVGEIEIWREYDVVMDWLVGRTHPFFCCITARSTFGLFGGVNIAPELAHPPWHA